MNLEISYFQQINDLINKIENIEIELSVYKKSDVFDNLKKINIELKNVFLMGEKESYNLFQIISNKCLKILKENKIDIVKNKYHARAQCIKLKKGQYDFENEKGFSINGYVFFKKNILKIEEKELVLNSGDIIFFKYSNKHEFLIDFDGIVFNFVPCSLLHSQFLNQWVPIFKVEND